MIRIKKTFVRFLHHEHLLVYLLFSIGAFIITWNFISKSIAAMVIALVFVFSFLFYKKYKEHYSK